MADQFLHRQAGQFEFLPHGQEPLGDRERGLQRRQESLWHGAHLPPRAQQHPDRMAADRTGLGDRTPLPVALSAPWRPWHSLRHGLVYLSLVEPGFRLPARYQLNPAPCGRLAGLRCSLTTRPLSRGVIPRQEPPSLNGPNEPCLPHDSNSLHNADSCFAELPILLPDLGEPHFKPVSWVILTARQRSYILVGGVDVSLFPPNMGNLPRNRLWVPRRTARTNCRAAVEALSPH